MSKKEFALPEGRLINESLFVKDQFNAESIPKYKVELVFPKEGVAGFFGEGDGTEEGKTVEDRMFETASELWGEAGEADFEAGKLYNGLIDGDIYADDREERGKKGDAYRDMWILRADTIYNLEGDDAPGGIRVYDEEVAPIEPANRAQIYRGCFGIAGVTLDGYKDSKSKQKCLKFYLTAFQKTADGDKLSTASDKSGLFSKRNKAEGDGKRPSRRRAARG
jgi:hypothetical protein